MANNLSFGIDYGLKIVSIKDSTLDACDENRKDIKENGRNSQEHQCDFGCKRLGCLHYRGGKQSKFSAKLSSFSTWNTQDEIIPKIAQNFNQTQTNDLMSEICDRFSFSNDVVEERSPHTLPYSRSEFPVVQSTFPFSRSKLRYTKSEFPKNQSMKKLLKLPDMLPSKNSHEHIDFKESVPSGCIDKSTRVDSFFCHLNSPNHVKSFASCDSIHFKNMPKNESFESIKTRKVSHTWDEYVLNMLSKSTANLILKDFTSPSRQEILNNRKKPGDSFVKDDVFSKDNLIDNISNCGNEAVEFKESKRYLEDNDSSEKVQQAVQDVFPSSPSLWSKGKASNGRVVKGMKKWQKHPRPVQKKFKKRTNLQLEAEQSDDIINNKNIEEHTTTKSCQQKMLGIVDEWISKWMLEKKWQEKGLSELLEGLESINDQERLGAVSAIGRAIFKKRNDVDEKAEETPSSEDVIAEKLKKMLNDQCGRVALAAAITLFAIDKADEKVIPLLVNVVKHGGCEERWIAVQCLAEYEHHHDCVIMELLSHVKGGDHLKANKSQRLLKHLSYFTMSIQYMLAEQLNSTSWKDRLTACKILPKLHGTLSRDIANKLSYLMWNDWNKEVRLAAGNSLGRSGNGKLVHDVLCRFLQGNDERKIIAALKKVSRFGFVTDRLYDLLSMCLTSPVNAVCLQTIKTITQIKLSNESISSMLVDLVSSERNFKIKTKAVKALGIVGDKSQPVRNCLTRALHFEKNFSIRLEACLAIIKLQLHDEEMVKVLRELLVVEENEKIKRQIGFVLESFGMQPTGDDSMSKSIQSNVRHLCGKHNVLARMLLDSDDFKDFLRKDKQDEEANVQMKILRSESVVDGSMERGFDATLEAYKIRTRENVNVNWPDISPSFIPYWSESNESLMT